MQKYIARRVLLFIPTLLLASVLIFGILRVLPGDVALAILGQEAVEGGGGTPRPRSGSSARSSA